MKTTTRLPIVLILLLAAAVASAQPGRGRCDGPGQGPGDDSGFRMERLAQRLDLSEEQVAQIDALHESSRAQGLETRKQILRLRNELEGLMLQDEPSKDAAAGLIRRIGELKTEQRVRRMETRLKMREYLTEEQLDKFLALGQRGRGGRDGRPGPDGRRTPGCDGDGPRGDRGQRGQRGGY